MTLGTKLKQTRTSLTLTLRQVEDATEISNAYLSQLENDKIKKPSANILYKLANLYKMDLNTLLSSAGIINDELTILNSTTSDWVNKLEYYADKLSEQEKQEILEYTKFKAKK